MGAKWAGMGAKDDARRTIGAGALAAAVLAACAPVHGGARAATFEVASSARAEAIVLHGPIVAGDENAFSAVAQRVGRGRPVVVTLSSNGGDVVAATTIGYAIHRLGYSTYVPDNAICVSSCALIWIAGTSRISSETAHIGFHAAFEPKTRIDVPEARTWIEGYLRSIAVDPSFIDYVYQRHLGQGMEWLTVPEANRYGLSMTVTASNAEPEARSSTDFVDSVDQADEAYHRHGRQGLLAGLKARYDAFDASPSLRAAFQCFTYETAAMSVDGREAAREGRAADPTFVEDQWSKRMIAVLATLGYDKSSSTEIFNTWITSSNATVASQR